MIGEFMSAVTQRDHSRVGALLRQTPDLASVCDPNCFGATALIRAASGNDREMVDLLLNAGADVDQRSAWWAGSFGVLDDCPDEMAAYLLSRGATLTPHAAARLGMAEDLRRMLEHDPALVHARGGDGQLPLHFARTSDVAALLLERGADIDARDVDHESTAAQWLAPRRPATVAFLIARGCQADAFMAATIGDVPLLRRLIADDPEGVAMRLTRTRFATSTRAAGHIYLFTIGEGCTLLHAAAAANQPEAVRALMAHGADVAARGGYDNATPLHQAAWADGAEAAGALLDGGADINALSGALHDNEPIGWAIVGGAVHVVRVLLERGAKLRKTHVADVAAGVRGQFRSLNPKRPASAWNEIAQCVAASLRVSGTDVRGDRE